MGEESPHLYPHKCLGAPSVRAFADGWDEERWVPRVPCLWSPGITITNHRHPERSRPAWRDGAVEERALSES